MIYYIQRAGNGNRRKPALFEKGGNMAVVKEYEKNYACASCARISATGGEKNDKFYCRECVSAVRQVITFYDEDGDPVGRREV